MRRIFLLGLFISLWMTSGCNPNQSGANDKKGAPEQTAKPLSFPATFPAYIPVYPGGQAFNTFAEGPMAGFIGKATATDINMVSFISTDTAEKIMGFYKAQFLKAGLEDERAGKKPLKNEITFLKTQSDIELVTVTTSNLPQDKVLVSIVYVFKEFEVENK
jgi:hypothetical protein